MKIHCHFKIGFLTTFLFPLLFISFMGCDNKGGDQTTDCSIAQRTYKHLIQLEYSDSLPLHEIEKDFIFFQNNCIDNEELADSLMLHFFNKWLASPDKNRNIRTYFNNICQNKKLSTHQQIEASLYLSITYFAENKIEKSDSIIETLQDKASSFDKKNLLLYYRNLGLLYNLKNKLDEATRIFEKAADLALKSDKIDNCELGNIYGNYANVYLKTGDYKKGIELLKKSWQFLEKCPQNQSDLCFVISNLGSAYSSIHDEDSALDCYKKVLLVTSNNVAYKESNFLVYINLIDIYLENNKMDSAQLYVSKASTLESSVSDSTKLMYLYMYKAICKAQKSEITNEIERIKQYINRLFIHNELYDIQAFYQGLKRIYLIKNDYKKAFNYERLEDSLKTVSTSADYRLHIKDVSNEYEVAQKNLEIQKQKSTIYYSRFLVVLSFAFIVIIFLIGLISLNSFKKRKKDKIEEITKHFANQLITQTEEERNKIAMELHDTINQDLLMLKKDLVGTDYQLTKQIDEIIDNVRQIARNIYPVSLPFVGLNKSLENLCNKLMNANEILITTELNYSVEINFSTQLQIFRIVQEALQNTIKHAEATAILLSLKENEDISKLELIIKDNGKGFDTAIYLQNKDCFGLHAINQRANLMEGKAIIDSSKDGTQIKIEMPI